MNKKERIVYERKIKTREKLRIPSGVRHQYLHFTNAPVKAYVVIGRSSNYGLPFLALVTVTARNADISFEIIVLILTKMGLERAREIPRFSTESFQY